MKIDPFLVLLLASAIATTTSEAVVSDAVSQLEKQYVQDCEADQSPHGYYGAFFQPCEFSFYHVGAGTGGNLEQKTTTGGDVFSENNPCSSTSSSLIGRPKPVHWLFQLQEHIDKDDWDSLSSDEFPNFEDLMLWPDQCVGVAPRCYSINGTGTFDESQSLLVETLLGLFPDGIPVKATHVQVDCRSDALELSRVAFGVAGGIEKNIPIFFALMATAVLSFFFVTLLCCYGCFRLCSSRRPTSEKVIPAYYAVPAQFDDEDSTHPSEKVLELSKKSYESI